MAFRAKQDGFHGGFYRVAGSVFPARGEKPSWADEVSDDLLPADGPDEPSEFRKEADRSANALNADKTVPVYSSADAPRRGRPPKPRPDDGGDLVAA